MRDVLDRLADRESDDHTLDLGVRLARANTFEVADELLDGAYCDARAFEFDHPVDTLGVSEAKVEDVAVGQSALTFDEGQLQIRENPPWETPNNFLDSLLEQGYRPAVDAALRNPVRSCSHRSDLLFGWARGGATESGLGLGTSIAAIPAIRHARCATWPSATTAFRPGTSTRNSFR